MNIYFSDSFCEVVTLSQSFLWWHTMLVNESIMLILGNVLWRLMRLEISRLFSDFSFYFFSLSGNQDFKIVCSKIEQIQATGHLKVFSGCVLWLLFDLYRRNMLLSVFLSLWLSLSLSLSLSISPPLLEHACVLVCVCVCVCVSLLS